MYDWPAFQELASRTVWVMSVSQNSTCELPFYDYSDCGVQIVTIILLLTQFSGLLYELFSNT